MTKTKSTILLIILLVVLLFLCVFSVMPKILIGSYAYNSPLNLLNLGGDLGKSVFGQYKIEKPEDMTEEEYGTKIQESIKIIRERLKDFNLSDATVTFSQSILTVRMNDTSHSATALDLVNQRGKFALSSSNDASKLADTTLITNKNIKKVTTGYSSADGIYYLKIDVDDAAVALLKASTVLATSSSPVTLYYYIDGVLYQNNNFQATSQYTYPSLYLYAYEDTTLEMYKTLFNNDILPLDITFESQGYAAPLLGRHAALISGILVAVAALAVIAALIVIFKLLGVASALSFITYMIGLLLLISLVYLPVFDIGALIGVIAAFALYFYTAYHFLNTVNSLKEGVKEFTGEKHFLVLFGRTRRHTVLPIVRIHAILFVSSVILWIFGIGALSSFAAVLAYASVLSVLANLFVFRLFSRLFISISSNQTLYYGKTDRGTKA